MQHTTRCAPPAPAGWCDGQDVRPWVVDITADLWAPGAAGNNTLVYYGLFQGRDPPQPAQQTGVILMQASLVLYTRAPADGGAVAAL